MRTATWILLGSLMSVPAFAGTWTSLWRTRDQQGQALLEAGHAAKAAARFTDPRLKAYADLEAGRYSAAAKLLAPFKDATSEYNRGNALAHGGHLRQALAAYDAALKQAPGDRDIRHNRDLVARMLRQHPPQSTPQGGGQGKHRGASQGANHPPGQAATGSSGNGQHQGNGQNHGQGQGAAEQTGAAGRQGKGSSASGSRSGSATSQGAQTAPQPVAGAGTYRHTPGQARRDAALAAAIARHQKPPGPQASGPTPQAAAASPGARAGSSRIGGGTYTPGPTSSPGANLSGAKRWPLRGEADDKPRNPVSEKTLALEQWLRQIPDNPAGLLRRKFLIQYMMRHPGEHP